MKSEIIFKIIRNSLFKSFLQSLRNKIFLIYRIIVIERKKKKIEEGVELSPYQSIKAKFG